MNCQFLKSRVRVFIMIVFIALCAVNSHAYVIANRGDEVFESSGAGPGAAKGYIVETFQSGQYAAEVFYRVN